MVKSEQAVTVEFTTHDTSDVLTDADATPVGTLVVNGTDNGATVTETNVSTGRYKAAFTLPALSAGDIVELYVTATIDSDACGGVVWRDVVDTKRVSDLNDIAAGAEMDLVAAPNSTAITAIQNGLAVPGSAMTLSDDAITAAKIAANAIGASELATDAVAEIADQVWDEAIAGHAVAGSTGAALSAAGSAGDPWATAIPGAYTSGQAGYQQGTTVTSALTSIIAAIAAAPAAVWAYVTRTLTQSASTVASAVAGSDITAHRGDQLSAALTSLGAIPADRTAFWFTVKSDLDDDDDESTIQIEETDGLLYLNGAAATAAQGSLTVDVEADGDVTVWLSDAATAELATTGGIYYDLQYLDATGEATTLASGTFKVTADVTRAIS